MSARQPLQGAKGGSTPHEATDTLRSTQRAEIVDLLGEGQIGGLVNGLKSVFLDGVPVENADGSRNFPEFGMQLTLGGPTDTGKPHAFGDVQTEVGVGVTVLAAVPVVRTIADATADSVRVTLTVPQLVEQKDNGDRVGAAFEFAIDVQSNGGGFVEKHRDTVSGKASSPYSRAVRISLAGVGPPPWDVRVRRLTPDSGSSNLVDAFSWASYTAISGVRMLYRNSAVAAVTFDAKNFQAVPSRWYDVMGISDWDIPVNYDPLARTVSGNWNGLWKQAWTNNPAWVLYNLVQHPRYGLGEYAAQLPDKWVLYQLSLWCDAMVPDGRGGQEPRFTINAEIKEQSEALRLLQDICTVFRGVLAYGGSTLTVAWDAPGEPVAIYAPANVVDGVFTYGEGSAAAKKSSCTCWYTDRSQAAKRMPATWDDASLVEKYGLRSMEINPIGVATPGQAVRMAKWALATQHLEDGTIAFRVGSEGPVRRLGEVFQVNDPSEAGERLAGRVKAASATVVQLDAPVTLLAGETYTLWVTQPHPTDDAQLVLEARTVTTAPGSVSSLQVTPAFSAAPAAQTMWLLEGSEVAPTLWRYVGINEVRSDDDGKLEYEISGVRHVPGKWALIELDQPLTPRPTRRLPNGAPPVASVTITEEVYFDGPDSRIRATVSWPLPAPGLRYVVAWRLDNGPWTSLAPTSGNTVGIEGLVPGVLEVQVQSLNALGRLSLPVLQTAVLAGDTNRPDDVADLTFTIVPGGVRLAWAPDTQPGYEKTRLSYGATFATSVFFWEGNSSDFVVRPPGDGTYMVWAVHVNRRGLTSQTPASIEVPYIEGSGGSDGLNNATVMLYQRAASSPALPSAAVTYNFITGAVTGLTNGWLASIPGAGSGSLWVIKAHASATTSTDSIGTGEWSAPVVLAADGQAGASAPAVDLTANPQVFITPANSTTPTPSSSTVSATLQNILAPTYVWTVDGVVQGSTSASLTVPAFAAGGPAKLVQCTVFGSGGVTAFDRISIFSLREGSDSISAGMDNEQQTIACDSSGNPSPPSQFPIVAQAYTVRGAQFLTSGVTYGIQAGSNSGFVSPSINASSGAVSIGGMSADTASIIFTATVGLVTIPMRFGATKSRAGQTGGAGQAGVSQRVAYALYAGFPSVSGVPVTTVGPTSLPAFNAWSPAAATSWSTTRQSVGTGQSEFLTQGSYDPATNITTWQVPYLAHLRVASLSALAADLGTINAGNITGNANIDIAGTAVFRGVNAGVFLYVPGGGSGGPQQSFTVGVLANSSFGAQVALAGRANSSLVGTLYGENLSTSGGAGVFGWGFYGIRGQANGNGAGVRGDSGTVAGSSGIHGVTNVFGDVTYGVTAEGGAGSSIALRVLGPATTNGRFTSTHTATAPLVLPVVSVKPAVVAGGIALHNTRGIMFSDGVNWYAPTAISIVA